MLKAELQSLDEHRQDLAAASDRGEHCQIFPTWEGFGNFANKTHTNDYKWTRTTKLLLALQTALSRFVRE